MREHLIRMVISGVALLAMLVGAAGCFMAYDFPWWMWTWAIGLIVFVAAVPSIRGRP